MWVTKNQIFVFIACVAFGGGAGLMYSLAQGIKAFIKPKPLKWIPDIAAFTVIAALYSAYSFALSFPSYRLYMTAGVFLGMFAYCKSLHQVIAKTAEKCYNITIKRFFERLKIKRTISANGKHGKHGKRKRFDGRKIQKAGRSGDGRGGTASRDTVVGHGLPTYRDK
ncbi:MAG: spore cortex biosynthesis protein YabQ [Clostridia bacterium]|nr:spore cortex biosynthesis protein YabQ [Clostridia bacterium]